MRSQIMTLSNDPLDGPKYVLVLDELTDEQHAILTETDSADWIRRVARASAVIIAKDTAIVSVDDAEFDPIDQDTVDMISVVVSAALTDDNPRARRAR